MISVAIKHRFRDFTLDLAFDAPGGVVALTGHSGAGKTSILNAVAGLLTPDQGRIVVNDRVLFDSAKRINLPTHQRRIGYVFQDLRLFPHLSVRANLLYGTKDESALPQVLDLLGIAPLLTRKPGTLSGGEKQRVAIGRALLSQPRLLLLDEPLASLDTARRVDIIARLKVIRDELKLPMLLVSHAADEVAQLATQIITLENGRII